MFGLSWREALAMQVMADGRTRTAQEITEEVEAMSGDQQVAAIQHWLPVHGGYRMENDD